MKKERTREEIINAIKQSVLRKKIAIAENQLDWYKKELQNLEVQ